MEGQMTCKAGEASTAGLRLSGELVLAHPNAKNGLVHGLAIQLARHREFSV